MTENRHEYYMARAIQLAKRGCYHTSPNPNVGCVIVKNHIIVGEGWHQKAGLAHAEINALAMASDHAKDSTVYLSLEPCTHFGKTPPCCDALIKAGIKTLFIAMLDPNPKVSGNSIEKLEAAGITVNIGLLASEARDLNTGFLQRMENGLPYVRCKLAMSLDGRTALASGHSKWITGPAARQDVQLLRAKSCAIITGINTILVDNPSLTVRQNDLPKWKKWHLEEVRQPLRVILDSKLRLPMDAKCLSEPGNTVVITQHKDQNRIAKFNCLSTTEVVQLSEKLSYIDLKTVLSKLADTYECNDVLIEAGPTLSGAFLQANLVDEIILYIAPIIMGNKEQSSFRLPPLQQLTQAHSVNISDIRTIGKDIKVSALCKKTCEN